MIIMGETGCGKTRLIRFMCELQAGPDGPKNLLLMKVRLNLCLLFLCTTVLAQFREFYLLSIPSFESKVAFLWQSIKKL